jgi:hypothetical protein
MGKHMSNDRWSYMRLRAGDELAGRTQHRSVKYDWSYAEREEFSGSAERYVRAVCVLLAEDMGDVAVEVDVVNGKAAWDEAIGAAACMQVVSMLSIVLQAMLEGSPPREMASIISANMAAMRTPHPSR